MIGWKHVCYTVTLIIGQRAKGDSHFAVYILIITSFISKESVTLENTSIHSITTESRKNLVEGLHCSFAKPNPFVLNNEICLTPKILILQHIYFKIQTHKSPSK